MARTRRQRHKAQRDYRDAVLFLAGLAGVIHETVFRAVDRPALLVLFGTMLGLPLYFRGEDKPGG